MLSVCYALQGHRSDGDDKQHAEGAKSFDSQLRPALPAVPARSDGPRSKKEDSAQMQEAEESAQVLNEVTHSTGVQGYSSAIKYAEAACSEPPQAASTHLCFNSFHASYAAETRCSRPATGQVNCVSACLQVLLELRTAEERFKQQQDQSAGPASLSQV